MKDGFVREPVVAGQFYEADPIALRGEIENCFMSSRGPGSLPRVNPDGPRRIVGMASPHAGYVFSGASAASGFSRLADDGIPSVVIIIGPSHRVGSAAIQTSGAWRTPLGDVEILDSLAEQIADMLPDYRRGPQWFGQEHSLEVQLPFLQYLYGESVSIVPIMMLRQGEHDARVLADAVCSCAADMDAVIIASTDMSHQQPEEIARVEDGLLLDRMVAFDPVGLIRTRPDITMCGRGPVAAMLMAAKRLGGETVEKVSYSHSGEVIAASGVVGYASLIVSRSA